MYAMRGLVLRRPESGYQVAAARYAGEEGKAALTKRSKLEQAQWVPGISDVRKQRAVLRRPVSNYLVAAAIYAVREEKAA
jgi:hypothetical protein